MTAHELMITTNHYLIKDGELTDVQKAKEKDGRLYFDMSQ